MRTSVLRRGTSCIAVHIREGEKERGAEVGKSAGGVPLSAPRIHLALVRACVYVCVREGARGEESGHAD